MQAALDLAATVDGAGVAIVTTKRFSLTISVCAVVFFRTRVAVVTRRARRFVFVRALAGRQIATASNASFARIAALGRAFVANTEFAQVSNCTQVVVVAGGAVQIGRRAASDRVATVASAWVVVVATQYFSNACAVLALVVLRADCAVVARDAFLHRFADAFASGRITTSFAASIFAIANHDSTWRAFGTDAGIGGRASIAIRIASLSIVNGFGATARWVAAVGCARIAVVTNLAGSRNAGAQLALVVVGAGVLVRVARHVV